MDSDAEVTQTEAQQDGRRDTVAGIDPALKLFIDDVVIPALLDRLSGTRRSEDPSANRPPFPRSVTPA
jgi:hypothetical protein